MSEKELNLLKNRFAALNLEVLENLLSQYRWEQENILCTNAIKIEIIEEIIKRKRLLAFILE